MEDLLEAHWDVLASVDFITIEVWTKSALVTFYSLFVMELALRRVHFAGCTTNPDQSCMCQAATNLSDAEDGFLHGKKYLLMDRDTKFSEACRERLGGMLRYYYRLCRDRHSRYYSEFRTMPSKSPKAAGHKDFLFKHSA